MRIIESKIKLVDTWANLRHLSAALVSFCMEEGGHQYYDQTFTTVVHAILDGCPQGKIPEDDAQLTIFLTPKTAATFFQSILNLTKVTPSNLAEQQEVETLLKLINPLIIQIEQQGWTVDNPVRRGH